MQRWHEKNNWMVTIRSQNQFRSDSTVSRRTVWSGIFRYRRASEVWLVAAGPSRCWAAPRGWALRLPAGTSGNTRRDRQQSSGSRGGGISCWPAATVAPCQVYVPAQALTAATGPHLSWRKTPIRWDPSFTFRSAGVKSRLTRPSRGATWNIFTGSRTARWKNSLLRAWSACLASDGKMKNQTNKSPLCVWFILRCRDFEETSLISEKTQKWFRY